MNTLAFSLKSHCVFQQLAWLYRLKKVHFKKKKLKFESFSPAHHILMIWDVLKSQSASVWRVGNEIQRSTFVHSRSLKPAHTRKWFINTNQEAWWCSDCTSQLNATLWFAPVGYHLTTDHYRLLSANHCPFMKHLIFQQRSVNKRLCGLISYESFLKL